MPIHKGAFPRKPALFLGFRTAVTSRVFVRQKDDAPSYCRTSSAVKTVSRRHDNEGAEERGTRFLSPQGDGVTKIAMSVQPFVITKFFPCFRYFLKIITQKRSE